MTAGDGALRAFAPAKVNLTLHVLGRRPDGWHDLDSLVAFADVGDDLALEPGPCLSLRVDGPEADAAGPPDDNLVLQAARRLAGAVPGLVAGRFTLDKRLPVAAGLGGGSADAAAALRLLARANGLAADDPRIVAAAAACGSDVPVCLDPRARRMQGRGEIVGPPLVLGPLFAVLANPRVACPTPAVFAEFARAKADVRAMARPAPTGDRREAADGANDLEAPAARLVPAVATVLAALRATSGCRLARLSGSGATCFALYDDAAAATRAAGDVAAVHPDWWIVATQLA